MNRFVLITSLSFGLLLSCDALDLNPHRRVAGVEDATSRYYFQNDAKKMGFRVDPKTQVSGNPAKAVFEFSDLETAWMTIVHSALTPDIPFDGDGLKKYHDLAAASLPAGSLNVVLEKEIPNAIPINGWTSHQYVFTCNFYGVSVKKSLTFLNFSGKEQLLITVSAPVNDYAKVYGRSYGILNSIYEMKPGEEFVQPGN